MFQYGSSCDQTKEYELYFDSCGNPLKDQMYILETSFQEQHGGSIGEKQTNKQNTAQKAKR